MHVRVCFQANPIGPVLFWCCLCCCFLCQVGFVIGNPSGSWLEIHSRKPLWKSGYEHTDEQAPIDDSVLQSTDYSDCIPGTTRISKQCDPVPCEPTIPPFGNDWRHHCLHYGHGPNATSFINVNSVPFLGVWYYRFQMMKSCPVTKNLTPQEQIHLLHGSK